MLRRFKNYCVSVLDDSPNPLFLMAVVGAAVLGLATALFGQQPQPVPAKPVQPPVVTVPANLAVYIPPEAVSVDELKERIQLQSDRIGLLEAKIDRLLSLLEKAQPGVAAEALKKGDEKADGVPPPPDLKLIVSQNCAACHSTSTAEKKKSGLVLIGDNGELVALERHEKNAVVEAVKGPTPTMPPPHAKQFPSAVERRQIEAGYSK